MVTIKGNILGGNAVPIAIHSEKKDSTAVIVGVVVGVGGFAIIALIALIAFFVVKRKRGYIRSVVATELAPPGPRCNKNRVLPIIVRCYRKCK
jgi:hypothetical protein